MKKIVFYMVIVSAFYTLNCFSQSFGWQDISANIPQSGDLPPDLSNVFFVSDNEGWITSSSQAEIYHTTDGGETFEVHTTLFACNAIYMLNENEGYAGGASGFVYRATDGGENWIAIGSMGATLADISFPPNGDTGYCCGINGNIHAITSSGVTKMTSNVNGNLYSISFPINSEEGWVCGGSIILTYFNGIWGGAPNNYPSGGYNAIYMVDTLNGWAVGDNGILAHTADGQNWFEQINPDSQSRTFYDTYFLNINEGWAVGISGTIVHTNNGGDNWSIEGTGITTNHLQAVHFTSPTNGYVVGNGKTLLKFGELTSVENEEELPTQFSLSQNYPNPFNPSTKIRWQQSSAGFVTLKIYDVLGREIETLVDEYKEAGHHSALYIVNPTLSSGVSARGGYTSGVYFYQLKSDNIVETKKMILMK